MLSCSNPNHFHANEFRAATQNRNRSVVIIDTISHFDQKLFLQFPRAFEGSNVIRVLITNISWTKTKGGRIRKESNNQIVPRYFAEILYEWNCLKRGLSLRFLFSLSAFSWPYLRTLCPAIYRRCGSPREGGRPTAAGWVGRLQIPTTTGLGTAIAILQHRSDWGLEQFMMPNKKRAGRNRYIRYQKSSHLFRCLVD